MGAALGIVALWLYALFRRGEASRAVRGVLLVGSLLAAFLGALAKEIVLTLPAWIGTYEWVVARRDRRPGRALGDAVAGGALFALPAAATLALRWAVVGLESDKLSGVAGDLGKLGERLLEELPVYAALGGLPLPLGLADYPTLEELRWLGWLLIALAGLGGTAALYRCAWRRPGPATPALGIVCLGLVVAAAGLLPVFWADLPLRRRYLFTPSVGLVLVAAALVFATSRRLPRGAVALLALVVAGSAGATLYRNDLYRRSGEVARNLIEVARRAPLDQPVEWPDDEPPRVALVTLPRAYGGDFLSGAYLLHHSDVASAFRVFGVKQPRIDYALKCYHAEDYVPRVSVEGDSELRMTVSFRTRAAFEAARSRDPDDDRRGRIVRAELESEDPEARTLTYRLRLSPLWRSSELDVLLYDSDAGFRRLSPAS